MDVKPEREDVPIAKIAVAGYTTVWYCPKVDQYMKEGQPGFRSFCANCKKKFLCATQRIDEEVMRE